MLGVMQPITRRFKKLAQGLLVENSDKSILGLISNRLCLRDYDHTLFTNTDIFCTLQNHAHHDSA